MTEFTSRLTMKEERWFWRWRHAAAYVFLAICIFDFIIMPIVYEKNDKIDPIKAVELSLQYKDAGTQNIALQTLLSKRSWEPLTLKAGGMFFMAFGAILGVAAFSRGQEKVSKVNMFGTEVTESETVTAKPKKGNVDNPDK